MRHDIKPNERAYSTKEVAEELDIATPTVRKYGQILERSGYEFFKNGSRRVFVQSDVEALQAIRDTDKPLEEISQELVEQQQERLATSETTEIAGSDTYDTSLNDPQQMRELLMFISKELAASREMNTQLANDMAEMKTTMSRLRQDHHVISSGIGNSTQKMTTKMEKLIDQQKSHYEEMLEEEREKSEHLRKEMEQMRDEHRKEWRLQSDFNQRLEQTVNKPKSGFEKFLDLFRK
ncbi:hypothetical protein H0266_07815 [Halobacillus locisalis]|uniref:HTH merR-type domain-containing protein n=1 Tax=Halobacillus locisalis TaxID=220753 RepID=A0A838CSQ5_9BACI|nr:hypothetical protein [Halobacillus locisalis]MBA2174795.1 hypothetical protein [Halobacillus locisalis]